MSTNRRMSRGQLPPYPGPPRQPPSYEQDCQDRLAQIDCLIDDVGEKKQAQIVIAYDATRKDVLDTARQTLKHWNRVLVNIKKRPNESDRDHEEVLARVNALEEEFQQELKKVEDFEKELDELRKQRTKVMRNIRDYQQGY
ncbi:hypothetical protein BR93DRAFT_980628 [Coniochaeta sp. PMI_546]|nr:hypothetical protein BR93DRAFT_980628 [Coniochaeta sp. PMI_546]